MPDNKYLLAFELTYDQDSDPQYRGTVIVEDPTTHAVEVAADPCPGAGSTCIQEIAEDHDWALVDRP